MRLETAGSYPGNAAGVMPEQKQPPSLRDRFKQVKNMATLKWYEMTTPVLRLGLENILRHVAVEYEEGVGEGIDAARERGDIFVYKTSHGSLFDTMACFKFLRQVKKRFQRLKLRPLKIALPYIATLDNGDKGANLQGFSQAMAPIIEDEDIVRAQLVRRKDEDKYKARANLLSFYKQMYALISGGHDVLIHAEGTVSSSRRDETGERKGMLPIETNALRTVMEIAAKLGKQVTVVPISISGSNNLHDPALGRIDPEINETSGAMTRNALRFGANFNNKRHDITLARLFVSKPINASELLAATGKKLREMTPEDWDKLNGVFGRKIADHLPIRMRGVYANDETLALTLEDLKMKREIERLEELRCKQQEALKRAGQSQAA